MYYSIYLKDLMKLLFLIQYEVRRPLIRKRYVVKYLYDNEPIIRIDFYIWWYVPVDEYFKKANIKIRQLDLSRMV